jgi:hypothetical protein
MMAADAMPPPGGTQEGVMTDETEASLEPTATPAPPPPSGTSAAPPPPPPPPPASQLGWAAPPPPPGSLGPAPGASPIAAPGWAPPPPTVAVPSAHQWRDLRGLSNAITVLFAVAIAGAVLSIVAFAKRISVTNDILNNRFDFGIVKRANDADDLVKAAGAIYLFIVVVLAVLVIIWTFRAMKNNEALGRTYPRFKPGWGIAGWLIPFANFVIPVLILQDLWRGSDARTPRTATTWRSNNASPLVGWYWTAFLVGSVLRIGTTTRDANAFSRSYYEDLKNQDTRLLAGSVVVIAAAILGILVFRRITARQEECLRAQQQAWVIPSAAAPPR